MSERAREMAKTLCRPLNDMNLSFLRTLDGVLNLVQVLLGFAALFASSFIWTGNVNIFFQFVYEGYGWQTLINVILLLTWIFALVILVNSMLGSSIYESLGKQKMLIAYGICLVSLIISAALESWYASLSAYNALYNARFIAVCILNWLLVLSYIALSGVTILFM